MMKLSPFWDMLSRRGISTYDLEYKYDINPAEISRLKHNHNFTLSTIDRYCELFDCRIEDIVIHIKDTNETDSDTQNEKWRSL
ncbi:MAG: helix-turn-helix transcriptional regulator [Lachnospiraceae bacterium]|nr:helix-turn-helix transcriptional regulator [Lachnospiraceae bacterium]